MTAEAVAAAARFVLVRFSYTCASDTRASQRAVSQASARPARTCVCGLWGGRTSLVAHSQPSPLTEQVGLHPGPTCGSPVIGPAGIDPPWLERLQNSLWMMMPIAAATHLLKQAKEAPVGCIFGCRHHTPPPIEELVLCTKKRSLSYARLSPA